MSESKEVEIPIEVAAGQLTDQALAGIIENFILREGTDYGREEVSFETKSKQIRTQIEKGEIKIVFDQTSETVSLLTEHDFRRLINLASRS